MRLSGLRALLGALLLAGGVTATSAVAVRAGAIAASITLTPTSGWVGSTVKVTGSNFMGGETVVVQFDTTQVGSTTAKSGGGLPVVKFKVPSGTALGVHTVQATGQTSGRTASAPYEVVKRVKIVGGSTTCSFFCYTPATAKIPHDTTVVWVNTTGAPHTVTRCTPAACGVSGGTGADTGPASSTLSSGTTYRLTLHGAGTYVYYCQIHGYGTMHGTITVKP